MKTIIFGTLTYWIGLSSKVVYNVKNWCWNLSFCLKTCLYVYISKSILWKVRDKFMFSPEEMSTILSKPEKNRVHGSLAPRKESYCQEWRRQTQDKLLVHCVRKYKKTSIWYLNYFDIEQVLHLNGANKFNILLN